VVGGSFDVIEATKLKSGVFGSFILVALMPVCFVNCFSLNHWRFR